MPTYSISAPDGQTYQIDGPAGASDDQVRAEVLRQHPTAGTARAAPKPSGLLDAAKSYASGLVESGAGLADNVFHAVVPAVDSLKRGMDVGHAIAGLITGERSPPPPPAPTLSSAAAPLRYAPQTTAGEIARTAGQMTPAALAPGNVFARAANVIGPTVGSELAGRGARALGAGPTGQAIARAAGGVAGGALASVRVNPAAVPAKSNVTLDDLQGARDAAYDAVDNANVQFTPQAVSDLSTKIKTTLADKRYDADFHPVIAQVVKKIDGKAAEGWAPTLSEMDDLRQFVRENAVDGQSKTVARLGKSIMGDIDGFVQNADPAQMTGTDSAGAADLLSKARDLHTRTLKVQAVNDALDAAGMNAGKSGSGGNLDNATRQALDRVRKSIPNLTDEEDAALRGIVLGGKGQNLLRQVGKLSPQGNGLMAAGNLAAAGMGGPLATIPGFAGLVSKIAADGMTKAKVQNLVQLMAKGGKAAPAQAVIGSNSPPLLTAPNLFSRAAIAGGLLSASPAMAEAQR